MEWRLQFSALPLAGGNPLEPGEWRRDRRTRDPRTGRGGAGHGRPGLDAKALLDATPAANPDWLPWLTHTRNVIVLAGTVSAIALLTLPSARTCFRER